MNEVIIYLIKVIAIHGLLYLVYRLFLHRSARHSPNRGYLLLSFLLAFIIPFLEIPQIEEAPILPDDSSFIIWLSEPSNSLEEFELVPVEEQSSFSYWSLLPWLYGVLALGFLIRSVVSIFILQRLKKHSEPVKKRWFTLFRTTHNRPFSFFTNVFIPKSLFGSPAFDQILAHECVHVRQFHSVDRLLLDFVGSLFWFNPFIYLYRNALIEIHEYQADEEVVNRFKDPIGYQEILFSQLQSVEYSGLVSHFNFSMIKKRIVMMNKQRKMSGWVYALTAPIILVIAFAFSSKEAIEPIEKVGNEIADLLGPEPSLGILPFWDASEFKVKTQFNSKEKDNKPSISPVKDSDLIRLSSGFGMRTHPIYKVKKMHQGVDFSCRMGSEIMASADGLVVEISEKSGGYGKMITIDHQNGHKSRYAQLSEFKVKNGDRVTIGEVIALSGSSGASTAPHLHYEIIKDGEHVDPIDYITDYSLRAKSSINESENETQDYTPSILPFKSTDNVSMTSGFGMRMHPVDKVRQHHRGIDFSSPIGTTVIATADGVIHNAEAHDKYGKFVLIDHGDAYMTRYAHLSKMDVKRGDAVKRGDKIGESGNSGASKEPHLHYEVMKVGTGYVDPIDYIKNFTVKPKTIWIKDSPKKPSDDSQEKEDGEVEETVAVSEREKEGLELARVEKPDAKVRVEWEIDEEEREKTEVLRKIQEEKLKFGDSKQEGRVSYLGDKQPLFVIDDEVVDNVSDLDPNDIQEVTVLKDKSATRLYGKKGKNGVIVIKTKDKYKKKEKSKNKNKSDQSAKFSREEIIRTQRELAALGYFELEKKPLMKPYKVLIDPGHGGMDDGTKSSSGITEKHLALEVSKAIGNYFDDNKDIIIQFTRESDAGISLKDRSKASEEVDLMISIHLDADIDSKADFTSVFVAPGTDFYEESLKVSQRIGKELTSINRESRIGLSDLYVLRTAKCPAIHVNLGFLSNEDDATYINSMEGKNKIATSISKAIELIATSKS